MLSVRLAGQTCDFSAAEAQLQSNLGLYHGRVVLSSRSVQPFFINRTDGLPVYRSPAQAAELYPYGEAPDYRTGSWINAQNPATGGTEEAAMTDGFLNPSWTGGGILEIPVETGRGRKPAAAGDLQAGHCHPTR